jgi:hypothetical protein
MRCGHYSLTAAANKLSAGEKLKELLGERWPVCGGSLVSAASDSVMTDEQWKEFQDLLGAKWDTCADSVVSAVRALGLINDKAAKFTKFKKRLGNDWQLAGISIASSARNLLDDEWTTSERSSLTSSRRPPRTSGRSRHSTRRYDMGAQSPLRRQRRQ